jgi:hypothetical protein
VLAQALRQLPPKGKVRLALDWTIEGSQHLLVVSLLTGERAVPHMRELKISSPVAAPAQAAWRCPPGPARLRCSSHARTVDS